MRFFRVPNTRVYTLRFTVYFGSIRCNTVKADICWRGYPFMKPKNPGMVSVLSLCVGLRQTAGIIPQNPLESDVTGSNGFYGRGDLAPIMSATSRRPTQTDARTCMRPVRPYGASLAGRVPVRACLRQTAGDHITKSVRISNVILVRGQIRLLRPHPDDMRPRCRSGSPAAVRSG